MIAQIEASHSNENVTQQLLSESPYIHKLKIAVFQLRINYM